MADKDNDIAWWSKGRNARGGDTALLRKFLPTIARDLHTIKMGMASLVKIQEFDKKNASIERQRHRASDYGLKYKKIKPTAEQKKVITNDKKGFFETIKDGLSSIFKYALLGLAAIGVSKLLSMPGVMDGIKSLFKSIIIGISHLIAKGANFLSDLLKDSEISASITQMIKNIFKFVAEGISKISDFFGSLISDPENKSTLGTIITSVVGAIFKTVLSLLDMASKLLQNNSAEIANGIITLFVKIADAIIGGLKFTEGLLQDPVFRDGIARLYVAIKDFISTVLAQPISLPGGVTLTLGQIFISIGLAAAALELGLAAYTGAILGRAMGNSLGGGPGGGGGPPGKGKVGMGRKVLDVLMSPTTALVVGAGVVVADQFMKSGKDGKEFAAKSAAANSPPSSRPSPNMGLDNSQRPSRAYPTPENLAPTQLLQSKMKKGDTSAYAHEPGTDILAQRIATSVPEFSQFTAFNDQHHNDKHPNSKHTKGLSIDLVTTKGRVNQGEAVKNITEILTSAGLKPSEFLVQSEIKGVTPYATGDHVHVEFKSQEAAEKFRNSSSNAGMVASAFARSVPGTVPTPTGETQVASSTDAIQKAATNAVSSTSSLFKNVASEGQKVTDSFKPKTEFSDTMISLLSEGPSGDLFKELDKMTGGKLGIASGELQGALRTRFMDETPMVVDNSKTSTSTNSLGANESIPSIYDDVLLSKLSMA